METREYLGHWLGVVSKALSRKCNAQLKQFDLTIQQFGVLNTLYTENRLTSRKLVNRLQSDSSSIMSLVDQLEKKGLIVRESSTRDRRIKHLVLTEKAITMKRALVKQVDELDHELMGEISADEKDRTIKTLRKILDFALDDSFSGYQ